MYILAMNSRLMMTDHERFVPPLKLLIASNPRSGLPWETNILYLFAIAVQ
jgi:hypothetical protein